MPRFLISSSIRRFQPALTVLQQLGAGDSRNLDALALQNRVAGHFTTAEIQGMIAETLKQRRVLTEFGGAPGVTLDALLVSLRQRETE